MPSIRQAFQSSDKPNPLKQKDNCVPMHGFAVGMDFAE